MPIIVVGQSLQETGRSRAEAKAGPCHATLSHGDTGTITHAIAQDEGIRFATANGNAAKV